jgi:transcriptional regulator with AbiEi antitoxin domain of type IV toxin-antitoxin system
MKEEELGHEAADRLAAALREVPFLAPASIRRERARGNPRIDFILTVRSPAIDRRLVCEVKPGGQPRMAREACLNLLDYIRSDERDYPVFVAPYISPAAAAVCDRHRVGYFDLAGNCRLTFDRVYIRREAFPNPSAQKRDLRSLYSPKAERILRVLLAAGKRCWRMQELADEAEVSLGQTANVKKLLLDREWIQMAACGFRLRSLNDAVVPMLTEWAGNYRMERSTASEYYSLKPIPQTEADLAVASRRTKARFAFSGFAGAVRFAPAVRYQRVTAYLLGDASALADRLGLKPVSSGANVTLIEPYDEGVFYGTRDVEGAPVVSPVQIYLDLIQTKGRGREAASAILEEVIQPIWR